MMKLKRFKSEAGFSLVELLIVMAISVIMTSVSLYYIYAQQRLYKPDEQSSYIIDLLQEARQKALTQKVVMRVEFDLTDNVARLINEGDDGSTATDDKVVRSINLRPIQEVKIEVRPSNVSTSPTELSPVPVITYVLSSVHPLSAGHKVATLRFKKDGTVSDAGTTATGGGSTVDGATLFVWQPDKTNANNATITRAITIIGTTGAIRLWNYYPDLPATTCWKDSRRFQ